MAQAIHDGKVPAAPGAPPPQALRDVRLNTTVAAVRLPTSGVGVEVVVEGQEEPLWAHAVVCTLPLGCLQKGTVAFEPPLPGTLACCCRVALGGWLHPLASAACFCLCPPLSTTAPLASTPLLPAEYKQQAIQQLGMGTEDRVAMLFDEASC